MEEIRFDDIDGLRGKITDTFGPFGREIVVSQQMIDQFAELTGDHQWIHVDVERARRESPFKTTIAHGFLILSLIPHLRTATDFQVIGFANVTNYGANRLRFVSPVPAGARIHARTRLIGVDARAKGTQVTQEIAVHVVGDDRPAVVCTMLALFQPPLG